MAKQKIVFCERKKNQDTFTRNRPCNQTFRLHDKNLYCINRQENIIQNYENPEMTELSKKQWWNLKVYTFKNSENMNIIKIGTKTIQDIYTNIMYKI